MERLDHRCALAQDMTIALIGLEMRSGYDIESVATVCSINEGGTCTVHGWTADSTDS